MVNYDLRIWPDPALRMPARPVEDFDQRGKPGDLRMLANALGEVMYAHGGAGLAAPQLGVLQRVIALRDKKAAEAKRMSGFIFTNPEIIEHGDERAGDFEGCLSLPGIQLPIERWVEIVITADDVWGDPMKIELQGWEARVVQHEIDHLDGKTILDYLPERERARVVTAWVREQSQARFRAVRPADYSLARAGSP